MRHWLDLFRRSLHKSTLCSDGLNQTGDETLITLELDQNSFLTLLSSLRNYREMVNAGFAPSSTSSQTQTPKTPESKSKSWKPGITLTLAEQERLAKIRMEALKWCAHDPSIWKVWETPFLLEIIDRQTKLLQELRQCPR